MKERQSDVFALQFLSEFRIIFIVRFFISIVAVVLGFLKQAYASIQGSGIAATAGRCANGPYCDRVAFVIVSATSA